MVASKMEEFTFHLKPYGLQTQDIYVGIYIDLELPDGSTHTVLVVGVFT